MGCRLTYGGHQKSVFAVELMENLDSVVSCDGTVHVSVGCESVCCVRYKYQSGPRCVYIVGNVSFCICRFVV